MPWRQEPLLGCLCDVPLWVTYADMLVTNHWPLKRAPLLTSLAWVCMVWRSESPPELSALWELSGWNYWLIDSSTVSTYPPKCKRCKLGLWSNLPSEHATKRQFGYISYSLRHRIRLIVQRERSHTPYQGNYCYIVSLVTRPRIIFYVDNLIWSYP